MIKRKYALLGFLVSCLVAAFLIGTTASVNMYNPWADVDMDGDVDVGDQRKQQLAMFTEGDPLTRAVVEYDGGWLDISDKAGQSFNVTHNLNTTNIMVDIQGKTTMDDGAHQKHLGLTGYTPGWWRTYGGEYGDHAYSVVATGDGGYAIAGRTISFGAGMEDFWVVKTDAFGNVEWNQTYGGAKDDEGRSLVQTSDGGYAIAGSTNSFAVGYRDAWLVKTDAFGNVEWNQTYGGTNYDFALSVVATGDGGYALAGYTQSFGAGGYDFWLVKTDASGNMQWNQTYGGTSTDIATSVVATGDGGYALAGSTISFGAGLHDFWVVKTNATGNHEWNQTYGGTNSDYPTSLLVTGDGGYALAGYTRSFGAGNKDFWLVKTDASGNIEWNQTYGGTTEDQAQCVVATGDGGYALAGYTLSFGAGGSDFWVVKTDATGNHEWNQTYGGTTGDQAFSVVATGNGGYALAGQTYSFGAGLFDLWLVKTDVELGLAWTDSKADTITLYRGATDPYWNYVRVRIWEILENP